MSIRSMVIHLQSAGSTIRLILNRRQGTPTIANVYHLLLTPSSIPLHLHLYPTSMWGRCGTIVASVQLGRTPPLLTVPSLSDRLSHSPPTSSSVFLSCFLALLYPSPSFLRTHLFSSHARTIASCVLGPSFKSLPLSWFLRSSRF